MQRPHRLPSVAPPRPALLSELSVVFAGLPLVVRADRGGAPEEALVLPARDPGRLLVIRHPFERSRMSGPCSREISAADPAASLSGDAIADALLEPEAMDIRRLVGRLARSFEPSPAGMGPVRMLRIAGEASPFLGTVRLRSGIAYGLRIDGPRPEMFLGRIAMSPEGVVRCTRCDDAACALAPALARRTRWVGPSAREIFAVPPGARSNGPAFVHPSNEARLVTSWRSAPTRTLFLLSADGLPVHGFALDHDASEDCPLCGVRPCGHDRLLGRA